LLQLRQSHNASMIIIPPSHPRNMAVIQEAS
jgi:hypothetical protein